MAPVGSSSYFAIMPKKGQLEARLIKSAHTGKSMDSPAFESTIPSAGFFFFLGDTTHPPIPPLGT